MNIMYFCLINGGQHHSGWRKKGVVGKEKRKRKKGWGGKERMRRKRENHVPLISFLFVFFFNYVNTRVSFSFSFLIKKYTVVMTHRIDQVKIGVLQKG